MKTVEEFENILGIPTGREKEILATLRQSEEQAERLILSAKKSIANIEMLASRIAGADLDKVKPHMAPWFVFPEEMTSALIPIEEALAEIEKPEVKNENH